MSNLASGFINDVYSYGNTGSSMANAVSYGAQQNQFDYNSAQAQEAYERQVDLASMQMAYNSAQAAEQRAYNEAMWEKQVEANRQNMLAQQAFNHAEAILAREFSSQEAEKNRNFQSAEAALAREFSADEAKALRNWQETMSNTSYQRSVADMKAAGINPILAYAQGGASTPGGGMGQSSSANGSMANTSMASSGLANSGIASSGMASMSQAGAPNASGGTFTGQGNNMSENLAIFGAIASTFGNGMTALANSLNIGQGLAEFAKLFTSDKESSDPNMFNSLGKEYAEKIMDSIADALGKFGIEQNSGKSNNPNIFSAWGENVGQKIRNLFR